MALLYACIGSKDELLDAIVNLVVEETFLYEKEPIRQRERFLALLEFGRPRLLLNAEDICKLLEKILLLYQRVVSRLNEADITMHNYVVEDIEGQLEYMLYAGFIAILNLL